MNDFQNKNILIVGASSGIGYALAKDLIERGATVYSASRHRPKDLNVRHIELDVMTFKGEIAELPEVLHGFVYCVGSINLKPFVRLTQEEFMTDFQLNVVGAVNTLQASLKALKKAETASIVFFSTVAVSVGLGFHASIAAAKGAVEGLTKSLASELAVNKIRVNAIAPSLTDTPLAKNLLASPEKREASSKRHPLGRIGTAEELASMTAFLLSDQTSWITGQVIGIDGGMSSIK
jgi:NAD(P)-dependent dehydrogenase (short-subunit alcohol dehydrogenase family)